MIAERKELVRQEIQQGTGAEIGLSVDSSGLLSAMQIWFDDLDPRHGPVAELRPHGLKRHRITLTFGTFSGAILRQIESAAEEDVRLARALVSSISDDVELDLDGQDPNSWIVRSGEFRIVATVRHEENNGNDVAVAKACREVIVPLMAAMAELIGYDVIEEDVGEQVYEGAILETTVRRRERNPRNRLLCIRLHGEKCVACGVEPKLRYGEAAGSIIEVHHLEALSQLAAPRPYDPAIDLVPLCPNCHRAVHTKRPVPMPVVELIALLETEHE